MSLQLFVNDGRQLSLIINLIIQFMLYDLHIIMLIMLSLYVLSEITKDYGLWIWVI